MKILKREKYTTPALGSAALEAEGLFCQSARFNIQVDETRNINSAPVDPENQEPLYFDF